MLAGKKTFILAVIGIVWGAVGGLLGYLEPAIAQQFVWAGLAAVALRLGIKKNGGQ